MSLPYFQFYTGKYLKHAAHLTLLEHGVYFRTLSTQWITPDCKMPDDPKWIARKIMARSDEEIEALETILSEFFVTKGGKLFNEPLLEQWDETMMKSEKNSKNGKKGGRPAKPLKSKQIKKANAKPNESHTDTDTDTDTDILTNVSISDKPLLTQNKEVKIKPVDVLKSSASEQSAKSYCAYRVKIKKPITITAANRLKTQLDTIQSNGGDPSDALGMCEEKGWASIQSDWYFNEKRNQNSSGNTGQGRKSANGSNASSNGSKAAGLGGAFERELEARASKGAIDSYIDVTPSPDDVDGSYRIGFDDDA